MKKSSQSSEGGRSSSATSAAPDPLPEQSLRDGASRTAADAPSISSLFSYGSPLAKPPVHEYRLGEEIAHSVSHGIGAALSIAALVICVVVAVGHGGGIRLAAALLYTIPMFLEYLMSTLYHALSPEGAKRVFKVLDHSFIYLYIAGSYTPFCLITLAESGGFGLCVFVWAVAVAGVAIEAFWTYRPRWVSVVIYLAFGWSVVAFLPALVAALPAPGLALLVAGGVCYSLGCLFYLLKKKPYMHFVFHLLVMAGSVFQFLSIVLYVL